MKDIYLFHHKIFLFRNIIFIFLLGILCSCVVEDFVTKEDVSDGEIKVQFNLPSQSVTRTKSNESEAGENTRNENLLYTLDVFFYEENGNTCEWYERIILSTPSENETSQEFVLTARQAGFTSGASYHLYAIANLPNHYSSTISNGISLDDLKKLQTSQSLNPDIIQGSFLMDGVSASVILNDGQNSGKIIAVNLKRAAAKIRMALEYKNGIQPASNAKVTKKFINYATNSRILDSGYDISNNTLSSMNEMTEVGTVTLSNGTLPGSVLYSYEHDWNNNTDEQTYILVNVPLDNRPENYYKIPVNYRLSNNNDNDSPVDASSLKKLQRNYLYDIMVSIDKEGSTSPGDPVEVVGECKILEWDEIIFETSFPSNHWLFVKEDSIRMINIDTYLLEYSADLPLIIQNLTAKYTAIALSGDESEEQHLPGSAFYPQITYDPVDFIITIKSKVPINYVPLYIEFDVLTDAGLKEHVYIEQYPNQYITVLQSRGDVIPAWHEDPEQNNYNLFTITTLYSEDHILGDPTFGTGVTDSTDLTINMISPRFVVASQRGIYTDGVTWTRAKQRCMEYGEDKYRSGWRMPTEAEIILVNTIQMDDNSAIKRLFFGPIYWYARKAWGHKMGRFERNGSWIIQDSGPLESKNGGNPFPASTGKNWGSSRGAIRCVHDDY